MTRKKTHRLHEAVMSLASIMYSSGMRRYYLQRRPETHSTRSSRERSLRFENFIKFATDSYHRVLAFSWLATLFVASDRTDHTPRA